MHRYFAAVRVRELMPHEEDSSFVTCRRWGVTQQALPAEAVGTQPSAVKRNIAPHVEIGSEQVAVLTSILRTRCVSFERVGGIRSNAHLSADVPSLKDGGDLCERPTHVVLG